MALILNRKLALLSAILLKEMWLRKVTRNMVSTPRLYFRASFAFVASNLSVAPSDSRFFNCLPSFFKCSVWLLPQSDRAIVVWYFKCSRKPMFFFSHSVSVNTIPSTNSHSMRSRFALLRKPLPATWLKSASRMIISIRFSGLPPIFVVRMHFSTIRMSCSPAPWSWRKVRASAALRSSCPSDPRP